MKNKLFFLLAFFAFFSLQEQKVSCMDAKQNPTTFSEIGLCDDVVLVILQFMFEDPISKEKENLFLCFGLTCRNAQRLAKESLKALTLYLKPRNHSYLFSDYRTPEKTTPALHGLLKLIKEVYSENGYGKAIILDFSNGGTLIGGINQIIGAIDPKKIIQLNLHRCNSGIAVGFEGSYCGFFNPKKQQRYEKRREAKRRKLKMKRAKVHNTLIGIISECENLKKLDIRIYDLCPKRTSLDDLKKLDNLKKLGCRYFAPIPLKFSILELESLCGNLTCLNLSLTIKNKKFTNEKRANELKRLATDYRKTILNLENLKELSIETSTYLPKFFELNSTIFCSILRITLNCINNGLEKLEIKTRNHLAHIDPILVCFASNENLSRLTNLKKFIVGLVIYNSSSIKYTLNNELNQFMMPATIEEITEMESQCDIELDILFDCMHPQIKENFVMEPMLKKLYTESVAQVFLKSKVYSGKRSYFDSGVDRIKFTTTTLSENPDPELDDNSDSETDSDNEEEGESDFEWE